LFTPGSREGEGRRGQGGTGGEEEVMRRGGEER